MNTIKIEKRNTLMVAHRGLSGLETENTIAAFIAACNRSYFACECDVHFTKDNEMVICHDGHIKRISNYHNEIKNCTLKTLKSKCYNDVISHEMKDYLRMPTLAEYCDTMKRYEKHAVIEMKEGWTENQVEQFYNYLVEADMLDKAIIISFWKDNLIMMRHYDKDIPMQLLLSKEPMAQLDDCIKYHMGLDAAHPVITPEVVEAFHKAGLPVNCWTVNDKARGEELTAMGVDYITTNILE